MGNNITQKKGIQHDIKRTDFLKTLGWNGMRIRWAEYKKLSYDDKHKIVIQIKDFLKE